MCCVIFYSREKGLEDGLKKAVQVPMSVILTANKTWDHLVELSKVSNITTKSDLQVHIIVVFIEVRNQKFDDLFANQHFVCRQSKPFLTCPIYGLCLGSRWVIYLVNIWAIYG